MDTADIIGSVTTRDVKRAKRAHSVAVLTKEYLQQWYLCTPAELSERWGHRAHLFTYLEEGLMGLSHTRALDSLRNGWKDHVPLYEYARTFVYGGYVLDKEKQEKVSKADYFLYEPLHKLKLCAPIQGYLIGPFNAMLQGHAWFVSRYSLKSYLGIVTTGAWLLTRHRTLFDDFTTIRIIHDVESKAKERGELIKNIFQHNNQHRALYDQMAIPKGKAWGSTEYWDLPGRAEALGTTLDFQISCGGMRKVKQGAHVDYDLIDDIESERHMRSPASREETETFFKGVSYSVQLGSSRRVLCGTFYSPHGVHQGIMDASRNVNDYGDAVKPTWDVTLLPAILNEGQSNEELLYPTRLTYDILDGLKQNELRQYGTDIFYQMQMMLRYTAKGRSHFHMNNFRMLDVLTPRTQEERGVDKMLETATRCVLIDSAWKDDNTRGKGANTAIVAVGIGHLEGAAPVKVLLDAIYTDEFDLTQGVHATLDMAKKYQADWIFPEEPGQKTTGQLLDHHSKERGLPYRQYLEKMGSAVTTGNIYSIVPKSMSGRGQTGFGGSLFSTWKWALFHAFIADFNAGNWRFIKQIPCLEGLIEEMNAFPNGRLVDFINALALFYDDRVQRSLPATRVRTPHVAPHDRIAHVPLTRHSGLVQRVRRGFS